MGVALLSVRVRAGSARTRSAAGSRAYVINLLSASIRGLGKAPAVFSTGAGLRRRGSHTRSMFARLASAERGPEGSRTESRARVHGGRRTWVTTRSPGTGGAGPRKRQHDAPTVSRARGSRHAGRLIRVQLRYPPPPDATIVGNADWSHTHRNVDHSARTVVSTAAGTGPTHPG